MKLPWIKSISGFISGQFLHFIRFCLNRHENISGKQMKNQLKENEKTFLICFVGVLLSDHNLINEKTFATRTFRFTAAEAEIEKQFCRGWKIGKFIANFFNCFKNDSELSSRSFHVENLINCCCFCLRCCFPIQHKISIYRLIRLFIHPHQFVFCWIKQ